MDYSADAPSANPVIHTRLAPEPRVLRGNEEIVRRLCSVPGALLRGHFELLAGGHTDNFFAFSAVAKEAHALRQIASWLAEDLAVGQPQAVLAPTTAGVALASALAEHLGVPLMLATLDGDGRASGVLGEPELRGQRLLLVNDVVTTGRGLAALAATARSRGATVVGAGWFLSRSPTDVPARLGVPTATIVEWDLPTVEARACAACAAAVPAQRALDLN